MRKAVGYTIVMAIFCAQFVNAQETSLSLQQAVEIALKKNREITIATLDEAKAHARFQQTNAMFLPTVKLSYSGLVTNNPLNAFGFKLQQQAITQEDFNPAILNAPSATQTFMAKGELIQPIINIDLLFARQAARNEQEVYAFKTARTKEFIVLSVRKAYAQLQIAYESKSVLDEAYQIVTAIYETTNNRFEKGYLQKSDLLQAEVQVKSTESRLAEAKSNIQTSSDYLGFLMGADEGVTYQIDSINLNVTSPENTIPDDRSDFKAMESMIHANEKMIQSGKMSYVPKLNAFGEYMFNDSQAFGFGSQAYLVGAQLSWTLFNGTSTRSKISEARLERDQTTAEFALQKAQAKLELGSTIRQLHDAQFNIQQQEAAVRQSKEVLRIVKDRYDTGLVSTTDVLQAQSVLAQQKLFYIQSIYQYNTTAAYLEFLTSSTAK